MLCSTQSCRVCHIFREYMAGIVEVYAIYFKTYAGVTTPSRIQRPTNHVKVRARASPSCKITVDLSCSNFGGQNLLECRDPWQGSWRILPQICRVYNLPRAGISAKDRQIQAALHKARLRTLPFWPFL